jgi:hypothetical protein
MLRSYSHLEDLLLYFTLAGYPDPIQHSSYQDLGISSIYLEVVRNATPIL